MSFKFTLLAIEKSDKCKYSSTSKNKMAKNTTFKKASAQCRAKNKPFTKKFGSCMRKKLKKRKG